VFYKALRVQYKNRPEALQGWTQVRLLSALRELPSYSLFKQPHRPERSNRYAPVVTSGANHQWQADLVEFPPDYARVNQGNRYLLVCVDVFSKKAYTEALKSKEGPEVTRALSATFDNAPSVPRKIQTDAGKEFYNRHVQRLFKENHITHFTTQNTEKAQTVERLNRTLKMRLMKMAQATRGNKWLDHYRQITASYNRTPSSAHGYPPDSVGPENNHIVRGRLYYGLGRYRMTGETEARKTTKTPPLRVGVLVRLHKYKGLFEKGYTRSWTTQVFRVTGLEKGTYPHRYTVEYLDGETVTGTFYGRELQVVDLPKRWAVHKTRVDKKKKMVLVTFDSVPGKEEWVRPGQLKSGASGKWWWHDPKAI
jgi:transposase InsO family protein